MKRAIAAGLLIVGGLAVAYGYFVTAREATHRDLIQRGDAAASTTADDSAPG